jgi:hypothetical protein
VSPDTLIRELATELQDTIRNLDKSHLRENPEEEFTDLAARLVLKLQRKAITIVPLPTAAEQMESTRGSAAQRIFDIFTDWLQGHPERHFITRFDSSGKFEIVMRVDGQVKGFLQGESVQDACGQAAQVISFNGGSIDGEEEQVQS